MNDREGILGGVSCAGVGEVEGDGSENENTDSSVVAFGGSCVRERGESDTDDVGGIDGDGVGDVSDDCVEVDNPFPPDLLLPTRLRRRILISLSPLFHLLSALFPLRISVFTTFAFLPIFTFLCCLGSCSSATRFTLGIAELVLNVVNSSPFSLRNLPITLQSLTTIGTFPLHSPIYRCTHPNNPSYPFLASCLKLALRGLYEL